MGGLPGGRRDVTEDPPVFERKVPRRDQVDIARRAWER
jgi:hypothetical protein